MLNGDEKAAVIGLIPIAAVGLGLIGTLARQWWLATEPGRTYEVTFVPPTTDKERRTCEARRDEDKHIELHVKVRAKKPVITPSHSFRLVDRQMCIRINRLWRFKPAPTSQVSVCRLWDADWERLRKADPWLVGRQPPALRPDGEGTWIADYGLKEAAVESTFLYRVEMDSPGIWQGFLQLAATGKAGRMSHTQRGVTLWP